MKERRIGDNEALATAYGFDHVSSSSNGMVNLLGKVNGKLRSDHMLVKENHG